MAFRELHGSAYIGLFTRGYRQGIRIISRIVYIDYFTVVQRKTVSDAGDGQDYGQVIFPFQPFLNYFKVEQAQKTATETLPEGDG